MKSGILVIRARAVHHEQFSTGNDCPVQLPAVPYLYWQTSNYTSPARSWVAQLKYCYSRAPPYVVASTRAHPVRLKSKAWRALLRDTPNLCHDTPWHQSGPEWARKERQGSSFASPVAACADCYSSPSRLHPCHFSLQDHKAHRFVDSDVFWTENKELQ